MALSTEWNDEGRVTSHKGWQGRGRVFSGTKNTDGYVVTVDSTVDNDEGCFLSLAQWDEANSGSYDEVALSLTLEGIDLLVSVLKESRDYARRRDPII